jgi:uncharacterized protein (DUF488 family)
MTNRSTSEHSTTIYTIGHGRHAFDFFLELLQKFSIEFVCDIRSVARSRWPHFNWRVLEELLRENGIGYEHLPECGGRIPVPVKDRERGLDRIMELAGELRVVLMCSESQPLSPRSKVLRANCHRVGLLAGPLRARGAQLMHILPDGRAIEIDETTVSSVW